MDMEQMTDEQLERTRASLAETIANRLFDLGEVDELTVDTFGAVREELSRRADVFYKELGL